MARGHHTNILLDDELHTYVTSDADRRGISVSAVIRDGLRAYYRAASDVDDRAWQEAYTAALAFYKRKIGEALAEVPERPKR